MTLSKEDVKKIENVVNSRFDILDSRLDRLESYMRVRFDKTDVRLIRLSAKLSN